MSNVFTLDSLREETERKFAPVRIVLGDKSEVELSSLLRLSKDERADVLAALEKVSELEEGDDDNDESLEAVVEAIARIFNAIADKPAKLLRELDGPDVKVKLTLMSSVLTEWAKATQLGEA